TESVDMIVVDYLGIMAGLNADEDDWKEIGQIAASLHELGRIYNFPVVTASQMNRPQGTSQSLSSQKYNNLRIARGSG
ncbi:DnaB-like helicase C-terminal domain-containing protein, partial [Streptomyces caeruleatus]